MATGRGSGGSAPEPMQAGAQMWEAGYRSLLEGWRQAQEFWTNAARSWGEMAGAWMGTTARGGDAMAENMKILREMQEASLAVAQAWMRLPMAMMDSSRQGELQEAITRLTQAQGRAYQMWLEAMSRMAGRPETTERDRTSV